MRTQSPKTIIVWSRFGEFILLKPLQKALVCDRIDETCKTKEMKTQINVMVGMEIIFGRRSFPVLVISLLM